MRLEDWESQLSPLCPVSFVDLSQFMILPFPWALELTRRLSSPKHLLRASFGSPPCAIRCCEAHLLISKMLLEVQNCFTYKSTEHSFPVGEDGSCLVNLKGKQQSRRVKFRVMCERQRRSMKFIFMQGEIVWPVRGRAEGELTWFPWQCSPVLKNRVLLGAGTNVRKGRRCLQVWSALSVQFLSDVRCFIPRTQIFQFYWVHFRLRYWARVTCILWWFCIAKRCNEK